MFSLSSLLESRNCVLHFRTLLIDSESRRKFNKLRLDAFSIPNYVMKQGLHHGARHGKTEEQKSTVWPGMRGRDVARKSILLLNFYKYSRSISQRSSLSWMITRNVMDRTKVQRVGWTCTRRPDISSHSRGTEKITMTMVSYLEQSRQNWAYETSIRFSSRCLDEKSPTPRIRRTSWRAYPSKSIQAMASLFKPIVTGQVWMELEIGSYFPIDQNSFCYSWFRSQSMTIHCNRLGV